MPSSAPRRAVAIGLITLAALVPAGCGEPTGTGGNTSGTGSTTPTQPGTNTTGTTGNSTSGATPAPGGPGTTAPTTPAAPGGTEPGASEPQPGAALAVDPAIPAYVPVQGISGTIKSVGSDTMNNLMAAWGETFKSFYPSVAVAVEGAGSSTAPPALIEGQAQFGPMSREMKQSEIDQFRDEFGYEPTALPGAIDCLAVYVHRDCPLEEITLEQIAAVFGSGQTMTWGDLGVTDPAWADTPVAVYGRNEASGTYGFFKEMALGGRDFRDTVRVQQGSSGVVQAVGSDPHAMGYSGIGYRTAAVKPLALSNSESGPFVAPSYEAALEGAYPLARALYVYVNFDARTGLDPLRAEFIKVMLSRQGQEAVIKDGYYPVTADMATEARSRLNLD
jgi:phosphate transport system substrate-binding protein